MSPAPVMRRPQTAHLRRSEVGDAVSGTAARAETRR